MSFITQIILGVPPRVCMRASDADIQRIVSADFHQNHIGREYDLAFALAAFKGYRDRGGLFYSSDNVITIFRHVDSSTLEFHCINGGTARDLTANVIGFLRALAGEATRAVTYYDNERISHLLQYLPFQSVVKRIDDGLDRTFEATIDITVELPGGGA